MLETLVFSDGMGKVKKYDMYGYVDKTGKEIVPVKYISIGEFKDGLAAVKGYIGRKMGYIDKSGKEVLPLTFDDAKDLAVNLIQEYPLYLKGNREMHEIYKYSFDSELPKEGKE